MNKVTVSDSWVRNPDGTPGFTASVFTGCWNDCPYCFARELANGRLKKLYLSNERVSVYPGMSELAVIQAKQDPCWPRFWPDRLDEIADRKMPAGIFLNIMGDWADNRIPLNWRAMMMDTIRSCPQHRFYLLTKQPQNLPQYSPFPDNCWVGATVDVYSRLGGTLDWLRQVKATVKFLSIEPLLESMAGAALNLTGLHWVIIGALTVGRNKVNDMLGRYPTLEVVPWRGRVTLQPRVEWVMRIVHECRLLGIPVFMKENLRPLFGVGSPAFVQELPEPAVAK